MSYLTKNPLICKMAECILGELLKCNKHFENFDVLKKYCIHGNDIVLVMHYRALLKGSVLNYLHEID